MGRKILILILAMLCVTTGTTYADVMVYPEGGYSSPEGWGAVATVDNIDLSHNAFYYWSLDDIGTSAADFQGINILFEGVYNEDTNPNWLAVYLMDGKVSETGFQPIWADGERLDRPNWSSWDHLGTWSDVDGPLTANDVAFSLGNLFNDYAGYLTNGNGWTIAIDPDCRFRGDKITVQAPVPEPATLFLVASGLMGLAGLRRKGLNKSGSKLL